MKVAMVFPGYGSQFVGMAKDLYDEYRIVQEYFEEAANCLNDNFVKLCFASSDAELGRMGNAYISTFLVSCAVFDLVKQEVGLPHAVAGYNQGEYAALFAAGGMSFPDGLYLLRKYSEFYSEALAGMDVQVARVTGLDALAIEDMCVRSSSSDELLFVAMYHDTTTHYIAGHSPAMGRARDAVEQMGGVTMKPDALEMGLHSPLMDDVYKKFKLYLEKIDCRDLNPPFLTGMNGGTISGCAQVKEYVAGHLHKPINWVRIADSLAEYDIIIEIAPGTTLSSMLAKRYPDKVIFSVNNRDDLQRVTKQLS